VWFPIARSFGKFDLAMKIGINAGKSFDDGIHANDFQ